MGSLRNYARSVAATATTLHNRLEALIAAISVAAAIIAGWRFGIGWGVATFLIGLLLIVAVTGLDLQRQVDTYATGMHRGLVYEMSLARLPVGQAQPSELEFRVDLHNDTLVELGFEITHFEAQSPQVVPPNENFLAQSFDHEWTAIRPGKSDWVAAGVIFPGPRDLQGDGTGFFTFRYGPFGRGASYEAFVPFEWRTSLASSNMWQRPNAGAYDRAL